MELPGRLIKVAESTERVFLLPATWNRDVMARILAALLYFEMSLMEAMLPTAEKHALVPLFMSQNQKEI